MDYPSIEGESMWAVPLGGNFYRLENQPVLTRNVSVGDIVTARTVDGRLVFDPVDDQ